MTDQTPSMDAPYAPVQPVEAPGQREAVMMRVLLRVLSGRAAAVSGVVLVFVLACWAMWQPSLLRAAIAAGFALFSLVAQTLLAWAER